MSPGAAWLVGEGKGRALGERWASVGRALGERSASGKQHSSARSACVDDTSLSVRVVVVGGGVDG